VVDDGSTDGSAKVAGRFGSTVRCVRQEHAGIGAARNTGLSIATGEYLAFLDADDLWTPRKLELQEAVLDRESHTDMVFGMVTQFISPEIDANVAKQWHCPRGAFQGFVSVTMLARRSVFATAGRFDEQWKVGEFLDWYARTVEFGLQAKMLNEVLTRRRIHGANTGIRQSGMRKDYVRILKASLERRLRAGAGSAQVETR
jgi:glycosyltransferase involved in cell wall biosynthesis